MTAHEERVLVKVARTANEFRAAVLGSLDIAAAERLVQRGLLRHSGSGLHGWFNVTGTGLREAERVVNRG